MLAPNLPGTSALSSPQSTVFSLWPETLEYVAAPRSAACESMDIQTNHVSYQLLQSLQLRTFVLLTGCVDKVRYNGTVTTAVGTSAIPDLPLTLYLSIPLSMYNLSHPYVMLHQPADTRVILCPSVAKSAITRPKTSLLGWLTVLQWERTSLTTTNLTHSTQTTTDITHSLGTFSSYSSVFRHTSTLLANNSNPRL